jgi:hypothetical protein
VGSLQTPVTSEVLTSLRSQIDQDANVLDGPSKFRLRKLISTAEKAFAEQAFLFDENRLLFEQNNKSRSRLSTRSTVISKPKVMSYEDIVEAQNKRDAKKAGAGGRGNSTKLQA